MAIDCEMDHVRPEWMVGQGSNIPCKVSIVNQEGFVVLDTLIKPFFEGQDINPEEHKNYHSLEKLHGIKTKWLSDAPTFTAVRDHILFLAGYVNSEPPVQDEK